MTATALRVRFGDDIFVSQRVGGISNYFFHLALDFARRPEIGRLDMPQWVMSQQLIDHGFARPMPGGLPGRRRVLRSMNAVQAKAVPRPVSDIYHETYYSHPRLNRGSGRTVVTVHDMTPELHPELFVNGNPHRYKRQHVEQADLILSVSETTRDDLLRLHPDLTGRVRVTPLGVGAPFTDAIGTPSDASNPTVPVVLYVGSRAEYKGFETLLSAVSALRRTNEVTLHLVGGGPLDDRELGRIADAGLAGCVRQTSPDDEELAETYRTASVFVFPSVYEGFGLPVLEAMASGCPVIISDAPALVEVAGGNALVFTRGQPVSLTDALQQVLGGAALALELRQQGLAHARRYSWEATAAETIAAYRSVL